MRVKVHVTADDIRLGRPGNCPINRATKRTLRALSGYPVEFSQYYSTRAVVWLRPSFSESFDVRVPLKNATFAQRFDDGQRKELKPFSFIITI